MLAKFTDTTRDFKAVDTELAKLKASYREFGNEAYTTAQHNIELQQQLRDIPGAVEEAFRYCNAGRMTKAATSEHVMQVVAIHTKIEGKAND